MKNHQLTRRRALQLSAKTLAGVAALGKAEAWAGDLSPKSVQGVVPPVENPGRKVDFSYAFAPPHRVTVGRPDAGERTLVDLMPSQTKLSWTYDNLAMKHFSPLSFRTPSTLWNIKIIPQIDGKPIGKSSWKRLDDTLPGAVHRYEDKGGQVTMEIAGGRTATLVRVGITNTDSSTHQYVLQCDSGNWGENPAWVDPRGNAGDHLLAGWNDRADRVLILGLGADAYSLKSDGMPSGPRNMVLVWNIPPGETRQGWLVRPYASFDGDLSALRQSDWAQEMEQGKAEWRRLIGRASRLTLPDAHVVHAYDACLMDLFIMREPLGNGKICTVPGTEVYRAGNSGEPLIVAVALNQNGLHAESAAGSAVSFEMQEKDGCWADKRGWMHSMWCASGFKSWGTMEHYRITGDKKFLAALYPRMLASSRWQEQKRAGTRNRENATGLIYGLMPRGFGDCGLMNDDDFYGVFFPHNIWAVYADRCTLEVAQILGKSADIPELKKIYETAYQDLMAALEAGAIREKDYRWIPGVSGKTSGSSWGALNIVAPCGLLPADHELVNGTLQKIEATISKGGQPVHTGWMADGAWVAITLDNVAEVHLARGNGDAAVDYLYSTLNHGTPLFSWCEERGLEPGTTKCSGDRQHLWTPVAVVRLMRDMMVLERGKGLDLAGGIAREWLGSGKPVGIKNAATHFGKVSYRMVYDKASSSVAGTITFDGRATADWLVLHLRLPDGLKVKSVDSGATVVPDGSGVRWNTPRGTLSFRAVVG